MEQTGIRQGKLKAIQEKKRKKLKRIEILLGANQYLSHCIEILPAQTDSLGQLLKKKNNWNWTTQHSEALNQFKQVTDMPCLAHYSSIRPIQ